MMGLLPALLTSNDTVAAAPAIEELKVDCSKVLNDTRRCPTGLNVDFLADDDRNRLLSPRRGLSEALRDLRPKYLRYPGGWKSAINLWSVSPFTASRPILAGQIPENWIRPGLRLTSPEGNWLIDPLDFDEFMGICRTLPAEPFLVIAYESCHWPPKQAWRPPSRQQLLDTAVAWVRYANRVKGYKVKYWEIGNETWLNNETWTNHIAPATYAADLVEFSKRMKAEDPTIHIGANGDSDAWWQAVLSRAAEHIDFLSVHSYPCWKWTNYSDYLTHPLEVMGTVKTARKAIAQYAPAHQSRFKIMLTEYAAGTFGDWDKTPADLGRALMTFDLQGQWLQSPDIFCSLFWNTHNIYSPLDGDVFSALMKDNSLSPIGRALWIWNHYLGDEMVATTHSASVRCFASKTADARLAVFLLNKVASLREAKVTMQQLPSRLTRGEKWVFHGNGPNDPHPTWERAGSIEVANSHLALRLEPVSLTVIVIQPSPNQEKAMP